MARPMVQEDSLAGLARCQDGVVSRGQLRDLGISRHRIRTQLRAGRWQEFGRTAIVLHTGPLMDRQEWWCAVFNSGPRAVLGGITAAQANRPALTGFDSRPIHVVVPDGGMPVQREGVKIHVSRRLDDSAIHPVGLPPRTRIHRSIADAAVWTNRPRHGCAILAAGVQQGLTRADDLRKVIWPLRGEPKRGLYLSVIGDIEGGAQALSELDFMGVCRRNHLPEPARQGKRTDSAGRVRYLDAVWEEWNLSVEVDGAPHLEVWTAWADMARQNDIVLGSDLRMLRFPSVALRIDEDQVVRQLRRGLRHGGWPG